MTDKLEILTEEDDVLKQQLDKIAWPVYYGNIKIQVRAGKPTLVVIERTVKLD